MRIQNLLRYWRNSLADGDLVAPKWRDGRAIETISCEALRAGQVDPALADKIVDAVEARAEKRRRGQGPKGRGERFQVRIDSVDVAISPFQLLRNVEHAAQRDQDRHPHAPFWIAARLHRDGTLSPPDDRPAWFVRENLQPSGRNDTIVGTLDAMDEFLSGSPGPAYHDGGVTSGQDGHETKREATPQPWAQLIAWVEAFFESVTGAPLGSLQLPTHARVDHVRVVPHNPLLGTRGRLLKLYDALVPQRYSESEEGKRTTGATSRLLATLASTPTARTVAPESPLEATIRSEHLGHMSEQFGLGPSQREAIHALLQLPEGAMMALNGPPGTGKTAWIQSVVATLWVERALAGGEPPIVVATSANNRAVTNILDTFLRASSTLNDGSNEGSAEGTSEGVGERWLPSINTYGLFLPSFEQIKQTKHSWAAARGAQWGGLSEETENWPFLEKAAPHFLERAQTYFGDRFEKVDGVNARLRDAMRAAQERITALCAIGERVRSLRATMPDASPEAARERLGEKRRVAGEAVASAQSLARDVDQVLATVPMLEEILAFLPPIRDRRDHRFARTFERHGLLVPIPMPWQYRGILAAEVEKHRQAAEARHAAVEVEWQTLAGWEAHENAWLAQLRALTDHLPSDDPLRLGEIRTLAEGDPLAVEPLIDRTLRRRLFLLAGRYWEGRWLLETRALLEDGDPERRNRQSRADCLRRYRRFAMMTPLFVSTVYMLPKFFDFYERGSQPLIEGIDLLLVEEAGQVAPELGGALFALAKRAVVLGDVFQIEPVWNVGRKVDDANRERHGAEAFHQAAFHSACGSLMGVAQARTHVTASGRADGLWLREHRRCVPGVIAYCQKLVSAYRAVLEPHREEIAERHLPAMGWAHVQSAAEKHGGSWRNVGQAEAIARWLVGRAESLETAYGEQPLEKIVGIVTPFRAQAAALRRSLETAGLSAALEVGTVHTFQGGELPVMIFSPVVTKDQAGPYFFDRNVNMLNVAVSRARDSFLVVGDMGAFDLEAANPSGLLARFLLAEEANELPDVDPAPHLLSLPEVERISGLEAHQRVLREAFEHARERLLIVSPYLTSTAIKDDKFIERIANAKARVTLAYSTDMANSSASAVADRLESAGAEVLRLRGFHAKTIAVDDDWYTEGSFNWLSAVRKEGKLHQNFEASIRCGSPHATEAIPDIWGEILRKWREEGR